MPTDVILDCDPGHDDAIAIMLALASPEVRLLAVTTVAGNQTLEKTTANAIRVLDHVGHQEIFVAAGAPRPLVRDGHVAAHVHGESGLDGPELPPPARPAEPTHAVDFIAATLLEATEPVTLVPTGPLTNIALLLSLYPDLVEHIERLVFMGGAIGLGNVTPAAEFNIWADPEAAHRVLSSGLDVTMVGLDVTHKALLSGRDADRLRTSGRAGKLAAELFDFHSRFHKTRYGWDGAPIHDAVALAHIIDPALLSTVDCGVVVDTGPELSRGRTYVDRYGQAGWPANCHVAVDVDSERFVALLIERISALD